MLRRSCIISHRKLAKSGGMPGCLQADQHLVQSVVGLATSALHGVKCFGSSSESVTMVMQSSVSSLVQSFSFIINFSDLNKHEKSSRSLGPQCGGLCQVEVSLTILKTENRYTDTQKHTQTGVPIESVPD